jgi:hypothetical protein
MQNEAYSACVKIAVPATQAEAVAPSNTARGVAVATAPVAQCPDVSCKTSHISTDLHAEMRAISVVSG